MTNKERNEIISKMIAASDCFADSLRMARQMEGRDDQIDLYLNRAEPELEEMLELFGRLRNEQEK